MFTSGDTQRTLATVPSQLEIAMKYRETQRIATSYVIGHNPSCMAYCMGIDNAVLQPPFPHVGRNQDGVFGALSFVMDQLGLYGHIPYGVIHDSARPSEYLGHERTSAQEMRVADLLVSVFRLSGLFSESRDITLPLVGRRLLEIGELPLDQYIEVVVDAVSTDRQRELSLLEVLGPKSGSGSIHAVHQEYRQTLYRALENPGFYVPVECRNDDDIRVGHTAAKEVLSTFARLLIAWPGLVEWSRGRSASAHAVGWCA